MSLFSGMSLCEYVTARTVFCEDNHKSPCTICTPLLNVARIVISNGQVQLSTAFKLAYPTQKYKTDIALLLLLQMPLLAIKLHEQKIWLLFAYMEDLDPMKFLSLTTALFSASQTTPSLPSISKSEIKSIMTLAQCDHERELIRYSVFRASGMS